MGDWDFLYEMNARGYSSEDIADAAACGVAPWQWKDINIDWDDSELEDGPEGDVLAAGSAVHFQSREGFPFSVREQTEIFHDLLDCAARHFKNTGRYLQVWGELGEIYAEIEFGLRRHRTHCAGSDGIIDGKLVEVKTISPEKSSDRVGVKRKGNFEQVLIVRIDADFQFEGRLLERCALKGGSGKYLNGRLANDSSLG